MSWGTKFEIVPEGRKFIPDIFAIAEIIKNMGERGIILSIHNISDISISIYHDKKLIRTEKIEGGTHCIYEELPSVSDVLMHVSLTKEWINKFIIVIEEDTGLKHGADRSPFVDGQNILIVFRNKKVDFGVGVYILHGVKEKLIKTRELIDRELLPLVEKSIHKKCVLDISEG